MQSFSWTTEDALLGMRTTDGWESRVYLESGCKVVCVCVIILLMKRDGMVSRQIWKACVRLPQLRTNGSGKLLVHQLANPDSFKQRVSIHSCLVWEICIVFSLFLLYLLFVKENTHCRCRWSYSRLESLSMFHILWHCSLQVFMENISATKVRVKWISSCTVWLHCISKAYWRDDFSCDLAGIQTIESD